MPFSLSSEYLEYLISAYAVPFGLRLLTALVVFYIGRAIAKALVRLFERMSESRTDPSLRRFLASLLYMLLMTVVIIAALDRLGVESTGVLAVLGAAGLAIGLALQGSLGNFASGVMLILFRPYQLGDVVTIAGHTGTVDAIEVFNTVLITADNQKIFVPNGKVTSGAIVNITTQGTRRIDLTIGIGYGDDIRQAKEIILEILSADERTLEDPEPAVGVKDLGESSVDLFARAWTNADDYWGARADAMEAIKYALDKAGITIPYPQRDVHTHAVEPKAAS